LHQPAAGATYITELRRFFLGGNPGNSSSYGDRRGTAKVWEEFCVSAEGAGNGEALFFQNGSRPCFYGFTGGFLVSHDHYSKCSGIFAKALLFT